MFRTLFRVAVAGAALLGCGGYGNGGTAPGGCETGGAGTLDIPLTLPPGVTGSVLVSGPSGFRQVITGSRAFSNLPAGQYELQIRRTVKPPAGTDLTGSAFGATGRTVRRICVPTGSVATAPVGYTLHPASGLLWVAATGTATISGFDPGVLLSGSGPAAVTLDFGAVTNDSSAAFAPAFDVMGNMWLADPVGQGSLTGRVLAFAPGDLGASGSPEAAVAITATALNRPAALAFDNAGNLWLANTGNNNLLMYAADQLAPLLAGPTATPREVDPRFIIGSSALRAPGALAFDPAGNLWVAGDDTAGVQPGRVVMRFDAAGLGASNPDLSPSAVITGDSTGAVLDGTSGLAFDAGGDLWSTGGGVRHYLAADLAAGGRRTVEAALFADSLGDAPQSDHGAFDSSGRLWVTAGSSTLGRIDGGGTSIIPEAFTSTGLFLPASLVFYPAPAGLPIP